MRAMTVVMSITGDAYRNSVLELMKTDEQKLPAPPLTQIHMHKHTHVQRFITLTQQNCNTQKLLFPPPPRSETVP